MITAETKQQTDTGHNVPTEKRVMKHVAGSNQERLFWLRVGSAQRYLIKKYNMYEHEIQIWLRDKGFWVWYLKLWTWADDEIMNRMIKAGVNEITWNEYVKQMWIHQEMKWEMNKAMPTVPQELLFKNKSKSKQQS